MIMFKYAAMSKWQFSSIFSKMNLAIIEYLIISKYVAISKWQFNLIIIVKDHKYFISIQNLLKASFHSFFAIYITT